MLADISHLIIMISIYFSFGILLMKKNAGTAETKYTMGFQSC